MPKKLGVPETIRTTIGLVAIAGAVLLLLWLADVAVS